jgi:hypothetical protein
VYNGVIRQNGHDASSDPHASAQLLVAHDAMPFLGDGYVPVSTALVPGLVVTKV